jgi:hypothetical protein
VIKGPDVLYRRTAMCHDYNCPLAAEEIDKKLEKGVDCECLKGWR